MAHPKFSKKFYELVASEISDLTVPSAGCDKVGQALEAKPVIERLALSFCDKFGADNPQFDHYRFLTACGLDAEKLLS